MRVLWMRYLLPELRLDPSQIEIINFNHRQSLLHGRTRMPEIQKTRGSSHWAGFYNYVSKIISGLGGNLSWSRTRQMCNRNLVLQSL